MLNSALIIITQVLCRCRRSLFEICISCSLLTCCSGRECIPKIDSTQYVSCHGRQTPNFRCSSISSWNSGRLASTSLARSHPTLKVLTPSFYSLIPPLIHLQRHHTVIRLVCMFYISVCLRGQLHIHQGIDEE